MTGHCHKLWTHIGTFIVSLGSITYTVYASVNIHTDWFYYVLGSTLCLWTGWMMWNWLVTSLAVGSAIVLYDGSPFVLSPSVLWDLIDSYR